MRMPGSKPQVAVTVEVPICTLARGARFSIMNLDGTGVALTGTYVESTPCSSKYVLDMKGKEHNFTTADGEAVAFGGGRKKVTYCWPGTLVVPTGVIIPIVETEAESQFEQEDTDMTALPGITKKAAASKNGTKVAGAVKSKKSAVPDHPCLCGCGKLCAGRFKMGHDGTFYKQLRQVVKGEVKFGALPGVIRSEVKDAAGAAKYLKSHGH